MSNVHKAVTITRVRTIFLSDVHLGIRACQADRLLDFLRCYSARELLFCSATSSTSGAWPQHLLDIRAQHGRAEDFTPGASRSEDRADSRQSRLHALQEYVGVTFGDIRIAREWIHAAADGRRYLLIHGDAHDPISQVHRLLAVFGDYAYAFLLRINRHLAWWRRQVGVGGYWSLSTYVKQRISRAMHYISEYESAVAGAARARGVDGVICGHIHVAAIKEVQGIAYVNTGDWVDSCTAVVEHFDGAWNSWRGARTDAAEPTAVAGRRSCVRLPGAESSACVWDFRFACNKCLTAVVIAQPLLHRTERQP